MKKIIYLLITLLLALALLFGCSAASLHKASTTESQPPAATHTYDSAGSGYYEDKKTDETYEPAPAAKGASDSDAGFASTIAADPSRKMIWIGEISLESTDFSAAEEALHDLISECGGFIQSSTVTGEGRTSRGEARLRNARYTIRIPTENFELFMKSSGNVATVITSSTNSDDVTANYFDTEARLRVLEIKEERLIEMLEQTEKADYTDELKYIIQLENELANVRYEIESLTGTLRRYDDLISYSTITVYLQEVREYTATPAEPESLGERISTTFNSSLKDVIEFGEDFIVWFIGRSPVLILLAVIVTLFVLIVRAISRRRKRRRFTEQEKSFSLLNNNKKSRKKNNSEKLDPKEDYSDKNNQKKD